MAFRPKINDIIKIDNLSLHFTEHPSAIGMPYGQTGRRATVYQVRDSQNQHHALKVFTLAFRSSQNETNASKISSFAKLSGLDACKRIIISPNQHSVLLQTCPDLTYAVLMPWMNGLTWQEIILSRRPLTPEACWTIAGSFLDVLFGMEQNGIAHCDLSGPNVLIDVDGRAKKTPVSLIDLEDMYIPGIKEPHKLPAGSSGYAHRDAKMGNWIAQADRFSGAVLLAEMLAWCDESVRRIACGEQYFSDGEMQTSSDRFNVIKNALQSRWREPIAEIFTRAWFSSTLAECPSFDEWQRALNPPKTPAEMLYHVQSMERLGRWSETLRMCDEFLRTENHLEKELFPIRARAQKLNNLDDEISKEWHKASESGLTKDWETCLKSITRAHLLAPQVVLYQAQLDQAEQELESALRIDDVEQAFKENKIDVAIRLLQMTSPAQPRSLALKKSLEKIIENRKLVRKELDEGYEALRKGDWKAAISACKRVDEYGGGNDPELQTIILQAGHLQNRIKEISERLKLANQYLNEGNLIGARETTNNVLALVPMLEEACELLNRIEQAEKDQLIVDKARREASKGNWQDVMTILSAITTKYAYVEIYKNQAQEHISWRSKIETARQNWEAQEVLNLLEQKPKGENNWAEMQSWARKIAALQKNLANAEKNKDYEQIIQTLKELPQNYPDRNQGLEQAQGDLLLSERINQVMKNYDINTALKISEEFGINHSQFSDLMDWIREQNLLKDTIVKIMTEYNLEEARTALQKLAPDHPVKKDLEVWILDEENRVIYVREACESYNTASLLSIMDELPSDHPLRNEVEECISTTKENNRKIHQAQELYDGYTILDLLNDVNVNYPGYKDLYDWAKKEIEHQEQMRKALIHYDVEVADNICSIFGNSHPVFEELSDWILNEKNRLQEINDAKKTFDYQRLKSLLSDVTHTYPKLYDHQNWISKQEKIAQDVEIAQNSIDEKLIDTVLKQLPKRHPKTSEWHEILIRRLENISQLNEYIDRVKEFADETQWDKVLEVFNQYTILKIPSQTMDLYYKEAIFQIDFINAKKIIDDQLNHNRCKEAIQGIKSLEKAHLDRNEVKQWLDEINNDLISKAQLLEERKLWKLAIILWEYLYQNIPNDELKASIDRCRQKGRFSWLSKIGIGLNIFLLT